jgi:ATP-dependent Clp protease ATP-binding subunit ClpC
MFERFTERARRVIVLAQEEARALEHNYIGTEHLLLGLLADGEGIGAQALQAMGLSLEETRGRVLEMVRPGKKPLLGHIPFTPRAKKSLELSLREALQLGDNYIGTEHILLGMLREGSGVAAQVLNQLGVDLSRTRVQVIALSPGSAPQPIEGVRAGQLPVAPRQVVRVDVLARLQEISDRLAAIEAHLGIIRPTAEPVAGTAAAGGGPEFDWSSGTAAVEPDQPAAGGTVADEAPGDASPEA